MSIKPARFGHGQSSMTVESQRLVAEIETPVKEPLPALAEEVNTCFSFNGQLVVVRVQDAAAVKAALGIVDEPADESEPAGEHEDPSHGLTFAEVDAHGMLTPASDPDSYRKVYFAAFGLATGGLLTPYATDKGLYDIGSKSGVEGAGRVLRRRVAEVMLSGAAGAACGIAHPAVDPWSLTDATGDMRWVRTIKLPDPTTKGLTAGDGERRMKFAKNLSGLPAHPELTPAEWLLEREATRYDGRPAAGKTAHCTRVYDEAVARAHKCGQAARDAANLRSATPREAALQYKLHFCLEIRRSNQQPHRAFEAVLAHSGIIVADLVAA